MSKRLKRSFTATKVVRPRLLTPADVRKITKDTIKKTGEWKHLTSEGSGTTSTSGGSVCLSNVPQGDTDVTRDGDMLQAYNLDLTYYIANSDNYNVVRVIVFQWFPATTPTIDNVLLNTGQKVLAKYDQDRAEQFSILYDKITVVNSVDSATVGARMGCQGKKIKIPRKKLQYIAASTTHSNGIYIGLVSDSAAVTHPSVYYVAKLNYMDM